MKKKNRTSNEVNPFYIGDSEAIVELIQSLILRRGCALWGNSTENKGKQLKDTPQKNL